MLFASAFAPLWSMIFPTNRLLLKRGAFSFDVLLLIEANGFLNEGNLAHSNFYMPPTNDDF
jgi:hypothetical protein